MSIAGAHGLTVPVSDRFKWRRLFPGVGVPSLLLILLIATGYFRETALYFFFWIATFVSVAIIRREWTIPTLLISIFLFAPTKPAWSPMALTDFVLVFVAAKLMGRTNQGRISFSGGRAAEESGIAGLILLATFSTAMVALGGGDWTLAAKGLLRLVEYGVFYVCLLKLMQDWKEVAVVEQCLIILSLVFSILGTLQFLLGPHLSALHFGWGPWWTENFEAESFRVYSVFPNPIYFSAVCAFLIPYLFDRVSTAPRQTRPLYFVCLALQSVCLLLTLSRTGLIGTILGLAVVTGLRVRRVLGAVLLATLALALTAPAEFTDRIFLRTLDAAANVYARVASAEEALQVIADHPVLGIGLGQYPDYVLRELRSEIPPEALDSLTAENTFLQFGAELGFLGILFILFLGFLLFRNSLRQLQIGLPYARGFLGGVVAFGVCNLFASMTAASMMYFMFLLLCLSQRKLELAGCRS